MLKFLIVFILALKINSENEHSFKMKVLPKRREFVAKQSGKEYPLTSSKQRLSEIQNRSLSVIDPRLKFSVNDVLNRSRDKANQLGKLRKHLKKIGNPVTRSSREQKQRRKLIQKSKTVPTHFVDKNTTSPSYRPMVGLSHHRSVSESKLLQLIVTSTPLKLPSKNIRLDKQVHQSETGRLKSRSTAKVVGKGTYNILENLRVEGKHEDKVKKDCKNLVISKYKSDNNFYEHDSCLPNVTRKSVIPNIQFDSEQDDGPVSQNFTQLNLNISARGILRNFTHTTIVNTCRTQDSCKLSTKACSNKSTTCSQSSSSDSKSTISRQILSQTTHLDMDYDTAQVTTNKSLIVNSNIDQTTPTITPNISLSSQVNQGTSINEEESTSVFEHTRTKLVSNSTNFELFNSTCITSTTDSNSNSAHSSCHESPTTTPIFDVVTPTATPIAPLTDQVNLEILSNEKSSLGATDKIETSLVSTSTPLSQRSSNFVNVTSSEAVSNSNHSSTYESSNPTASTNQTTPKETCNTSLAVQDNQNTSSDDKTSASDIYKMENTLVSSSAELQPLSSDFVKVTNPDTYSSSKQSSSYEPTTPTMNVDQLTPMATPNIQLTAQVNMSAIGQTETTLVSTSTVLQPLGSDSVNFTNIGTYSNSNQSSTYISTTRTLNVSQISQNKTWNTLTVQDNQTTSTNKKTGFSSFDKIETTLDSPSTPSQPLSLDSVNVTNPETCSNRKPSSTYVSTTGTSHCNQITPTIAPNILPTVQVNLMTSTNETFSFSVKTEKTLVSTSTSLQQSSSDFIQGSGSASTTQTANVDKITPMVTHDNQLTGQVNIVTSTNEKSSFRVFDKVETTLDSTRTLQLLSSDFVNVTNPERYYSSKQSSAYELQTPVINVDNISPNKTCNTSLPVQENQITSSDEKTSFSNFGGTNNTFVIESTPISQTMNSTSSDIELKSAVSSTPAAIASFDRESPNKTFTSPLIVTEYIVTSNNEQAKLNALDQIENTLESTSTPLGQYLNSNYVTNINSQTYFNSSTNESSTLTEKYSQTTSTMTSRMPNTDNVNNIQSTDEQNSFCSFESTSSSTSSNSFTEPLNLSNVTPVATETNLSGSMSSTQDQVASTTERTSFSDGQISDNIEITMTLTSSPDDITFNSTHGTPPNSEMNTNSMHNSTNELPTPNVNLNYIAPTLTCITPQIGQLNPVTLTNEQTSLNALDQIETTLVSTGTPLTQPLSSNYVTPTNSDISLHSEQSSTEESTLETVNFDQTTSSITGKVNHEASSIGQKGLTEFDQIKTTNDQISFNSFDQVETTLVSTGIPLGQTLNPEYVNSTNSEVYFNSLQSSIYDSTAPTTSFDQFTSTTISDSSPTSQIVLIATIKRESLSDFDDIYITTVSTSEPLTQTLILNSETSQNLEADINSVQCSTLESAILSANFDQTTLTIPSDSSLPGHVDQTTSDDEKTSFSSFDQIDTSFVSTNAHSTKILNSNYVTSDSLLHLNSAQGLTNESTTSTVNSDLTMLSTTSNISQIGHLNQLASTNEQPCLSYFDQIETTLVSTNFSLTQSLNSNNVTYSNIEKYVNSEDSSTHEMPAPAADLDQTTPSIGSDDPLSSQVNQITSTDELTGLSGFCEQETTLVSTDTPFPRSLDSYYKTSTTSETHAGSAQSLTYVLTATLGFDQNTTTITSNVPLIGQVNQVTSSNEQTNLSAFNQMETTLVSLNTPLSQTLNSNYVTSTNLEMDFNSKYTSNCEIPTVEADFNQIMLNITSKIPMTDELTKFTLTNKQTNASDLQNDSLTQVKNNTFVQTNILQEVVSGSEVSTLYKQNTSFPEVRVKYNGSSDSDTKELSSLDDIQNMKFSSPPPAVFSHEPQIIDDLFNNLKINQEKCHDSLSKTLTTTSPANSPIITNQPSLENVYDLSSKTLTNTSPATSLVVASQPSLENVYDLLSKKLTTTSPANSPFVESQPSLENVYDLSSKTLTTTSPANPPIVENQPSLVNVYDLLSKKLTTSTPATSPFVASQPSLKNVQLRSDMDQGSETIVPSPSSSILGRVELIPLAGDGNFIKEPFDAYFSESTGGVSQCLADFSRLFSRLDTKRRK